MMVKRALETGYIEGDGPYYPQPRTPIRPAPARSFDGRLYAVASSDDSIEAAAELKARDGDVLRPPLGAPPAVDREVARHVPRPPPRRAAAPAHL